MADTAIISIDGHVKGSRREYRDYVPAKYLEVYDEQVKAAEDAGMRDAGNLHPEFGPEVQWDSDLRIRNLESVGVVAEPLRPLNHGVVAGLQSIPGHAVGALFDLGPVRRVAAFELDLLSFAHC